jgi:uncharacterized protein (TIGR03435 family)
MLNLRVATPEVLVDLNRVTGLATIREDAGVLRIGAMTRQRELLEDERIAAALANFAVNRTVINRTGLDGAYDAQLRFATEGAALAVTNRSDDASPIFTAVQEQLGLKLQSDRGPVPFVVIDSVQKPSPD